MPKGSFINVDIKDAKVKKALRTLIARGENMQPLTAAIAEHLYTLTDENFDVKSAYDGTPWARLSDKTLKYKKTNTILYESGALRDSLDWEADSTSAVVGVNAYPDGSRFPYPATHQFGSKHVPARPYLPFDEHGVIYDTVIDDILMMVKDYLEL